MTAQIPKLNQFMERYCQHQLLPNDGTSELQYLALVQDIITNGDRVENERTGVGTLSVHGRTLRFDLSDGTVPLLTTKRVPWKSVAGELLWFLSGSSNIRPLLQEKVTIWSEWPHANYIKKTGSTISVREFEAKILADAAFAEKWGDLGPVYGVQWRRWKGSDGKVYDQIGKLVHDLKHNPGSRRLLFHAWNVAEVEQMALPPCHLLYQCHVAEGRLSMSLYQRSCDTALGVPFNIASAAFLVHMLAQQTGLKPGSLFWVGHDVHLYLNHLDPIAGQLDRTPRSFPKLSFSRHPESLFNYKRSDFVIQGYEPDPSIKMEVAV